MASETIASAGWAKGLCFKSLNNRNSKDENSGACFCPIGLRSNAFDQYQCCSCCIVQEKREEVFEEAPFSAGSEGA